MMVCVLEGVECSKVCVRQEFNEQRGSQEDSETLFKILPYLSDFGLVFFGLGADLPGPVVSLVRVSADRPLLDCSSILCLSYSLRTTSDREGGGWNVTGVLIGAGSCFESLLLFLRRVEVEFFLSTIEIKRLRMLAQFFTKQFFFLIAGECSRKTGMFRVGIILALASFCPVWHSVTVTLLSLGSPKQKLY